MSGYRISDIAAALSAECVGDCDLLVQGARNPVQTRSDDLAVAMSPKYSDDLKACKARSAILWEGADWQGYGLDAAIFVKRPRMAMAHLTRFLKGSERAMLGTHATAFVESSAVVGEGSSIGPFAVIDAQATIGTGAQIGAHVTIGKGVVIGDNCWLGAGVRISENVVIGDDFVAHCGVVIGADGFSYVTEEKSTVEAARGSLGSTQMGTSGQKWLKIQSLGGVTIGNDVEIGANSNVDAGTIRATTIGDGSKLDALVQVGHNVQIGTNCLLCGQVGVAGSTIVGNSVVLGGQVGVADNISIGDGVIAGAGTILLSNVPAGRVMMGYPGVRMESHIASYKALRRLPRILERWQKSKD